MKQLIILLILFTLYSCDEHFKENELYGFYVPVGYKNTFDTIELKPQGVYHRKVYDRNNKLALEMNGKWYLEKNSIIHLNLHFFNLDRDIEKFPELLQDTLGGRSGLLETFKGHIQFCVGYYQGENCYQKIK